MSSTQNVASPRAARPKQHQHSKSATQALPNNNGKQSQRRQKGNRANNSYNGAQQQQQQQQQRDSGTDAPANEPPADHADAAFADSAVLSSEEVQIPTGPRNAKKHTQSQPSSDRVFSPTTVAATSLTDSELGANNNNPSASPAKAHGAYAGPTFHASPAPSALPIPKFLSKSVPAKSHARPPTPPEDGSESSSPPSPSPSPARAAIPIPPRHEDSPLDVLFKADRAEKARNANGSPASATLSVSPNQPSDNGRVRHFKHPSYSSLNAIFPIELDAESKNLQKSPPPAAPPVAHRSVTAPSKLPQVETFAKTNTDSAAIQDLLDRLSFSQKKPTASTPPRSAGRIPSEPSSRLHTPSPFRSASGPTTPVPAAQDPSDFFYGNRNLSPLFKAVKSDSAKRNSGLRTEITADSPIMPQGGFPPVQGPLELDPNAVSRNYLDNILGGPVSPRRGSTPNVQLFKEAPNNRKLRTPKKRSHHARPDSFPRANGNTNGPADGTPIIPPKSTTNPFIPSSVRAKPKSTTKSPDSLSLEQDLKRLLNLDNMAGDMSGVR